VRAVALDLDGVLGDTRPLWRDWAESAAAVIDVAGLPDDRGEAAAELDRRGAGNWRTLLDRFAADRAPVYLRPSADVTAALRRLAAEGVELGAYTDAPAGLAEVAVAHLGASRRLTAVEAGTGALERLLARLGPDTAIVRTREDLLALEP
jgi:phosphoglycolate phosphatase-like HAD superfamily hydrolase